MRRLMLILLVLAAVLALAGPTALAQTDTPTAEAVPGEDGAGDSSGGDGDDDGDGFDADWFTPLSWADTDNWGDSDWWKALFYVLGGIFGAVAVFYGVVNQGTPSDEDLVTVLKPPGLADLDDRISRELKLTADGADNADEVAKWRAQRSSLVRDATRQAHLDRRNATLLYLVGSALAPLLLAADVLQAIGLGVGWTAVVGVSWLKRDAAQRGAAIGGLITEAETELDRLVLGANRAAGTATNAVADPAAIGALRERFAAAKRLL